MGNSLKPYKEPQIKEVKRMPKVGEYIKLLGTGEICEVIALDKSSSNYVYVRTKKRN